VVDVAGRLAGGSAAVTATGSHVLGVVAAAVLPDLLAGVAAVVRRCRAEAEAWDAHRRSRRSARELSAIANDPATPPEVAAQCREALADVIRVSVGAAVDRATDRP
jgi:hypothetical protein